MYNLKSFFSALLFLIIITDNGNLSQVGDLKKGLNPLSMGHLNFESKYLTAVVKTGIITGILALAVRTVI